MKPGMQWPIGIVAILATSVIGNIAFMRVANNDPAFAIEPDYYKRAVAFDTTMHEAQVSDSLHWSATVAMDVISKGRGSLRLELRDRTGSPVIVDSVQASAFFVARANDVAHLALKPDIGRGNGFYIADLPVLHAGQWDVRIDARRHDEHFVTSLRTEVARGIARQATPPARDAAKGTGK